MAIRSRRPREIAPPPGPEGEELRCCERHGEYAARKVSVFGHELLTPCPACMEEAERRAQGPKGKESGAETMRRMNIEPEFYGATLGNFTPETGSQEDALAACRKMAAERTGEIVLSGPCGTGKTHLACAVCRELSGAVYTVYEISTRIRQSYTALAAETELGIVKSLASLPFLAIDEIGRTKGSDAEKAWLSYVLDKRHARRLPTMLLSNRPLERRLPKGQEHLALEAFLGGDIISRFRGGAVIEISGRDFRRPKEGQ